MAMLLASLVGLSLSAAAAAAAEESDDCGCRFPVNVSGDYAHHKAEASVNIAGAAKNAAAFREEINGKNFNVTVANLPAGKYTITIGEAETLVSARGERLFDVSSGSVALAKSFDIVAAAGGAQKVCSISAAVQHGDDSDQGPLTISFVAKKNEAKFNTLEVKDASGDRVVAVNAADLAPQLILPIAVSVPDAGPPIWRDAVKTAESAHRRFDRPHVAGGEGRATEERRSRHFASGFALLRLLE